MFQFPHLSLTYWVWQTIFTGSIRQIWLENSDYYALVETKIKTFERAAHTMKSLIY